jgi:hypothetical protein
MSQAHTRLVLVVDELAQERMQELVVLKVAERGNRVVAALLAPLGHHHSLRIIKISGESHGFELAHSCESHTHGSTRAIVRRCVEASRTA